ncbi:2-amino-4-hydroxy-6-hydroxymethyldihydropteridine diphosphokinase [Zeaxanthinibacter enoshimensis]|uniref:2-amino-4-hydroxy-6- hydroxymethyldihydropteridine diphosphokinase n=1 Tax=Zeaxanthinibacter enoshimensis TaxID=392009 RepID=UPI00356B1D52
MTPKSILYLAIGSNEGQTLNNLQQAVFAIRRELGEIMGVSKVYRSASWGFDGPDFLNACVMVQTELPPTAVMETILRIEKRLGRQRKTEEGYESRTIDIDLLYYDYEVINQEGLTIPHPKLQERKFVLRPLSDIAPQFYHPVLNKDTRNLLQQCKDKIVPEKTDHKLYWSRAQLFAQVDFMAIEGNIGAGKTTLAKKISEDYNAKLVLERFADNPFLPKFYEDPARYAFPLEMSFLAERYQQFVDDTTQFDLFKNFMISDYDIFKSLIFAKVTLQEEEFNLYRKMFNFMYKEVKKPGVYVYLYQKTERLLDNIKKRGRDYEQQIQPDYLDKIQRGYMDFLRSNPQQNSLILDVSDLDFVTNRDDYDYILDQIQAHLTKI